MAVTKVVLINALYDQVGLNKREAKEFVEAFFAQISQVLEQGIPLKILGFGNFNVRKKSSRIGRNPRTGEPVLISERCVVTFKPSPKLKKRVMKNSAELAKNFERKNHDDVGFK